MAGRAVITLVSEAAREKAHRWLDKVPLGGRVILAGPQRTKDQNAAMWAKLTDISEQLTLSGRRYKTEQWKTIFLKALGREVEALPELYGESWFPAFSGSSGLSRAEMSDLLTLMQAYGDEHGVMWSDVPPEDSG